MSAKSPKARHARLLSNGFFPPEMPSCFYSERFGSNRDAVLKAFGTIPSKKKGPPHFHLFKSERAVFNFPRFGREDRRHAYINPVSYFYLSKILAENYVAKRLGLIQGSIDQSLWDRNLTADGAPKFDVALRL